MSQRSISTEIIEYLLLHPEAQDTIEGIAEWWLLEHQIAHGTAQVESTLRDLVAAGFVASRRGADGRVHYRLNPEKREELRRQIARASAERDDADGPRG